MAEPESRTTRKQSLQLLGSIFGSMLTINIVFYLLSSIYFEDKAAQVKKAIMPGMDVAVELAKLETSLESVRLAFLILTLLVAGLSYAAAFAPRLVGHGLAVAVGLASIVGGVAALFSTMPEVLAVTLIVIGLLLPPLAYLSVQHSRPAWSFVIALLAVMATVTFFGAPKIRNVLDIGLWHALIIPALQIVGVIALTMLRSEYQSATPAGRTTHILNA